MRTSLNAFDPMMLISLGFDKMEVRTAFSPPAVVNLREPSDPATSELMREVQPAVIFTGPAGRLEIAPYGLPEGISDNAKLALGSVALGIGAGLVGLFLFARR